MVNGAWRAHEIHADCENTTFIHIILASALLMSAELLHIYFIKHYTQHALNHYRFRYYYVLLHSCINMYYVHFCCVLLRLISIYDNHGATSRLICFFLWHVSTTTMKAFLFHGQYRQFNEKWHVANFAAFLASGISSSTSKITYLNRLAFRKIKRNGLPRWCKRHIRGRVFILSATWRMLRES